MSKKDLINEKIRPENYEKYHDHLLEQYKIYVATAESVSTKRGMANTFFLTLNTLTITTLATLHKNGFTFEPSGIVLFPLLALLALCLVWWRLNLSYKQLNDAKFQVIDAFEENLPARPFVAAEWKILKEGRDPKFYKPFTEIEKLIPLIFAAIYVFLAATILFLN